MGLAKSRETGINSSILFSSRKGENESEYKID